MSTADPAALLDMQQQQQQQREERAAAGAAASSSGRYARRPSLARHDLPLDLLLHHPTPSSSTAHEATPASCARARRDLYVAPGREAGLMLQAAAIPLAIFAYGFATSDSFCRGEWDRYWTSVPRVRLPELRAKTQFGNLAGGHKVFMRNVDDWLRMTTRWIGRTPPELRPKPKGRPGGGGWTPPTPPPVDW